MEKNPVIVEFEALPQNQGFARAVAGAYCAAFDPTVEELTEIKTAVSEAVSNSVIHGYEKKGRGKIRMELSMIDRDKLSVKIIDWGKGIPDVKKAMEPLFSTEESGEMSGMGFTVMESFTDKIFVESAPEKGTAVTLIKYLDTYYDV